MLCNGDMRMHIYNIYLLLVGFYAENSDRCLIDDVLAVVCCHLADLKGMATEKHPVEYVTRDSY